LISSFSVFNTVFIFLFVQSLSVSNISFVIFHLNDNK
jgi:hypothetical protein